MGEMVEQGQLALEAHRDDISQHGEPMDASLSSTILSLPELAEFCRDDPGDSAALFNLTNVSLINTTEKLDEGSKINVIVGNRKIRKCKMSTRHEN